MISSLRNYIYHHQNETLVLTNHNVCSVPTKVVCFPLVVVYESEPVNKVNVNQTDISAKKKDKIISHLKKALMLFGGITAALKILIVNNLKKIKYIFNKIKLH